MFKRKIQLDSDEALTKMPDGRPIFAWENEIGMAQSRMAEAEKLMKQAQDLMRIIGIVDIESQREPWTGDLVIRVRMEKAVRDVSPHLAIEKYYERDKSMSDNGGKANP